MSCKVLLVLCFIALFGNTALAQKPSIEPLRFASGTILTFHLQAKLNPTGNALDMLPRGTAIVVKIQDSIDSTVNHDGTIFRGSLVSSVTSGNEILINSDAEVRGLFVLLRSPTHPDGFRYELLLTGVTDHGKTVALTASLNPSFSDITAGPPSRLPETRESPAANGVRDLPPHP
jgi:hypothetical protein